MSVTCPNINLSDWKSLVAVVGKYEAYKDYLETDGKIRNPEVVKAKVESRNPLNQTDCYYILSKKEYSLRDIVMLIGYGFIIDAQKELLKIKKSIKSIY